MSSPSPQTDVACIPPPKNKATRQPLTLVASLAITLLLPSPVPPCTMAPGILTDEAPPVLPTKVLSNEDAPRNIFPDGIRTSGQHPPLYDALKPYSEFPKEITGPTVWTKEEFESRPEAWTHPFTDEEIADLGRAADAFIASGTPLTGISKVSPPTRGPRHTKPIDHRP